MKKQFMKNTRSPYAKEGDIVAFPLLLREEGVAIDHNNWTPKEGEPTALAQVLLVSRGDILIGVFNKEFSWNNEGEYDIQGLSITHAFGVLGVNIRDGYFIRIFNTAIDPSTPYSMYSFSPHPTYMIVPFFLSEEFHELPVPAHSQFPNYGTIIGSELLTMYQRVLLWGTPHYNIYGEEIDLKSDLESKFLLKEENKVSNYFPEATNNPQWIIDKNRSHLEEYKKYLKNKSPLF